MNTKKNRTGSRPCDLLPQLFYGGNAYRKEESHCKRHIFLCGEGLGFETFLKTIVRDYLAVDDPAAIPEDSFVDKVESDAA